MLKVAPTLLLEELEPSVSFFVDKLGFEKIAEVPSQNGDKLDFAMLNSGSVEIHFQRLASATKDIPYFVGAKMPPSSFLYIDVNNVNELHESLKEHCIVPLEKTFYGATHFFIKEPGGHVIGFSQNEE